MKVITEWSMDLKTEEAAEKITEAIRLGLRDCIVAVHADAVRGSPWLTGNNARSIASEVSGMGVVVQDAGAEPEQVVDDSKLEAACYSTSGYGGFLETGTVKMNARPYFRPAFDMHKDELAPNIQKHLESET